MDESYSQMATRLLGIAHNAIDPVNAFGSYGNVAAMALPMGRAMPFNIRPLNMAGRQGAAITQLPGRGVRIGYDVTRGERGGYHANIAFDRTARAMKTGAKEGVDAMARVGSGVKEFVNKVKPESMSFTAAYDELIPIYDKAARSLAEEFGGVVHKPGPDKYFIQFPNFRPAPPK